MSRLKATTCVPPRRLWVVSRVACIHPCNPTASSCVNWSRSEAADPATQATEARRGGKAAVPVRIAGSNSRMTEPAIETRASEWRSRGAVALAVKSSDSDSRGLF